MPKRNFIWMVAIVAAAAVTLLLTRNAAHVGAPQQQQIAPVAQTYRLIEDNYVYPIGRDELLRGAVEGMVARLDEFSTYIPPENVAEFTHRISGQRRGLGLRVEVVAGQVRVIGPLAGSPAYDQRIFAGDVLVEIDGETLAGKSIAQVNSLLNVQPGLQVELLVLTIDGELIKRTLRWAEFPVQSVTGLFRDKQTGKWVYRIEQSGGLVYFRINEFVADTCSQFQQAYHSISSPKGIVLDLRGDPGGLLSAAIELADMFLDSGDIVTINDRSGPPKRMVAHSQTPYRDVPVVVLIDSRTASGAELLAGALKAHGRAVVVGVRSMGKGCVQKMINLPGGLGQVNLTTSQFHVHPDVPITRRVGSEVWGIEPHEIIETSAMAALELQTMRELARVMPRPLPRRASDDKPQTPTTVSVDGEQEDSRLIKLLDLDRQLAWAVQLLGRPELMNGILELEKMRMQQRQRIGQASSMPVESKNE